LNWFIATGISNHQRGCAIDVSLARVIDQAYASAGQYRYLTVNEFSLYEMPSPMHELSVKAAIYRRPVSSDSATAWQNATWSDGMAANEAAQNLQKYCTDAGLTPLSSEWWHFNDLTTRATIPSNSMGDYVLSECVSVLPVQPQEG
jgi:D-alanyl-D-alanine dipeptidase